MLREQLIKRRMGQAPGFHWRGEEVSRLEGFSDAVFGFVITLLVISTAVPKNFNDLLTLFSFSNVGSFAICFLTLVILWRSHYIFFRRYGLEDGPVFILNTVFLFIVTLYIYPLKFLFAWMLKGFPTAESGTALTEAAPIGVDQIIQLMVIYGLGIVFLYLSELGFYLWAYHKRSDLRLTPLEVYDTFTTIGSNCIFVAVGLVSIMIALFSRSNGATWAGLIYMLLAPMIAIFRAYRGRVRRRHLKTSPTQTELPFT